MKKGLYVIRMLWTDTSHCCQRDMSLTADASKPWEPSKTKIVLTSHELYDTSNFVEYYEDFLYQMSLCLLRNDFVDSMWW